MSESPKYYWITVMGSFSPNDRSLGMIIKLPKDENEKLSIPIKNLNRPVHSSFADMNEDGLNDIIVSEYGKWKGKLSLYLNQGQNVFSKDVILEQTGCIKTVIHDFNKDGKLDVISLFGQGNEGFFLHWNLGNGKFQTQKIIALSPSHGSSYFDLFDFNEDGHLDIIYCAGDNADFPAIKKPYHGVYIYLNDGQNNFSQHKFIPVNGAYKAIPADYDRDGDIDIAVISFFPDFSKTPNEGFTYLQNNSENYEAFYLKEAELGRWIVMDAKDYDKDGDLDLALGSLAFEVPENGQIVNDWTMIGLPFVILENKSIAKRSPMNEK